MNRPTLELLKNFLVGLRDQQSNVVLQWPVGQSDVALLHPLAMLSVLCATKETTTKGYIWCPSVRDFRTLYFPWRGSGTGADQRGILVERNVVLKRNQFHVTRPLAGQPDESDELALFHETLAHLIGLSKQDERKPHLAHPTLAELYPTFGALGGEGAPRPFGTVTRDLFARVEHGAGLKKMLDCRGAISQPKTAPFALFGVCPRADAARVLAHAALITARGGRPPDICMLDLGPPNLRRIGHGWEEAVRSFMASLRKLHGEIPILAVTQDPFERALPIETFHAKVLLADESLAYVGSANFLSSSETVTLETGVIVDGSAAGQVARLLSGVLRVARDLTAQGYH